MRLAINIIGFQATWWACLLSASAGIAWVGILVMLMVLAIHLTLSSDRARETFIVLTAGATGYAADALATLVGVLEFGTHAFAFLPAPLWIAALWLAFATTLKVTFGWFAERPMMGILLGAISGPLSYLAGSAFGVLSLPLGVISLLVLAASWGILVPVLIGWSARQSRSATKTSQLPPTAEAAP
jgi:hypothetical protein